MRKEQNKKKHRSNSEIKKEIVALFDTQGQDSEKRWQKNEEEIEFDVNQILVQKFKLDNIAM